MAETQSQRACTRGLLASFSPFIPLHRGEPTGYARTASASPLAYGPAVLHLHTAAAKEEYRGKTYYFCAEVCHGKFKEEPEKYAG